MAISRRNILIGLGTVLGGGGALVSTGAFTTVSAERSVEVSTTGDASAFLTLEGDENYVDSPEGEETLTINLGGQTDDKDFNKEAITTLDGVVTITNNAQDDSSATIGVSTDGPEDPDPSGEATLLVTDGNDNNAAVVTFYVGSSGENSIDDGSTQSIDQGNSAELDVEVDTRDSEIDDSEASDGGLTIIATED